MEDSLNAIIHSTIFLLSMGVATFLTIMSVMFWHQLKFKVMDISYTMPWFGKIVSSSKNPSQSSVPGWTQEELNLCAAYHPYAKVIPEHDFNDNAKYLLIAGDVGRKEMPKSALGFIALLVLAEGYGFSYLLGTWVNRDGTSSLYTLLAVLIAFVISGIMLWLTHSAGNEIRRNKLLAANDKTARKFVPSGSPDFTGAMQVGDHSDVNEPLCVQSNNRVVDNMGDKGTRIFLITTILAMIIIAGASFWMREKSLSQQIDKETQMQQQTSGNPFGQPAMADGFPLPKDVVAPQTAADKKINDSSIEAQKSEGGAAFFMLSAIFVFTQIVSIGMGMKYGFVGKQSSDAFRNTKGFATYNSYYHHYSPFFRLAQARLQHFQQKMESQSSVRSGLRKTFADYCEVALMDERKARGFSSASLQPTHTTTPAQNISPPVNNVVTFNKPTNHVVEKDEADRAIDALEKITDRTEKLAFLKSVSDPAVRAEIKFRLERAKNNSLAQEEEEFGDVI